MSTSVSGTLLIGVPVVRKDYDTVVKAFEHKRPKSEKYCSQTGRALWRTENSLEQRAEEHGLQIATTGPDEGDWHYLGVKLTETDGEALAAGVSLTPEEYAAKLGEVREKLIAFGIKRPVVQLLTVSYWS